MLHTYQIKRKPNKRTKKHNLPSFNFECQQKHKELRKADTRVREQELIATILINTTSNVNIL